MFKVAPRYLSGVSLFLGDDISRRETEGELAVFLGQATKGPSVPVQLQTPESAVALYGSENPLVKALYEFYDGYADAGKNQNLKFVVYRIGGVPARLVTSYGLDVETTDAYNGIEDDYFAYVNNTSADSLVVKLWDKSKLLVLDSSEGINTGNFTINSLPVGDGTIASIYGKDIDADPLATPVKLSELVNLDIVTPGGAELTVSAPVAANAVAVVVGQDISLYPSKGVLKISEVKAAVTITKFVEYTSFNAGTKTFTLAEEIGTSFTTAAKVALVGATLVKGDSQLDLGKRELYEKMKNALLDIELYTPDYIVPGGVDYGATETVTSTKNKSTVLTVNLTATDTYLVADAAGDWPQVGVVDVYDGSFHNYMNYSGITALGEDFRVGLVLPTFTFAATTAGQTSLTITGGATAADVLSAGYIKIGTGVYAYTVANPLTPLVLTLGTALAAGDAAATSGQKVPGTALANITLVQTTFQETKPLDLGIGYVKETDEGGYFAFEWSDTKAAGYNLAHFGYLFANFCNEAAVGFNTPLCGMNVGLPESFDRQSVVSWIGKLPKFKTRVDNNQAIEDIYVDGTGLLGDATLVGRKAFNRIYMSKPSEGVYVDPAFGLLMTDEGLVDGHEVIDTYNKVVDLGKFICVGAGLITFSNRASSTSYVDTCGIYALGQLAGKPKNEGISFSKIGTASNANVSVIVNRNLYNDLASLGYIVVTREKGLGWVINNSHSVARNQSAYVLISTTRTIKYVVEGKRSILVNFIGKPVSRLTYESARTAVAASFQEDVKNGFLATTPVWDLIQVRSADAVGKFELACTLNPAIELTQVDIDAVIERTNGLA